MKHSVAALIIVASLGLCADAQAPLPPRDRSAPPPSGTGRIRGRVAASVPALSLPLDGEWDPAFFEKVRPAATSLKLTEGQTLALNLDLIE